MNTTESGTDDLDGTELALVPKIRWVYTPGQDVIPARRAHPLGVGITPIARELPDGDGILVPDRRVSRGHATLTVEADGTLSVRDGGSRNGTFVNRQPVLTEQPSVLRDGDVLRVGDSLLVVRYEPLYPLNATIDSLYGVAAPMAALRHDIRRVARDGATVLIQGETGTGKELIAEALHRLSGRSGPFVAVNCSAIPNELAESSWFGHVAGAFTGARPHVGFFEQAHTGTLFLDEIGDMPLLAQAKLLRTIQERYIVPVGGTKPVACDVRLIAATNRDLKSSVAEGKFRLDMLARLGFIELYAPPLRQRREDVLALLAHKLGTTHLPAAVTPAIAEGLLLDPWPDNVRDIQHVATKLRLLGLEQSLRSRFGSPSGNHETAAPALIADGAADPAEAARLKELICRHHGVVRRVAMELKCSRRQVDRLLKRHGIAIEDFRR